MTYVSGFVAAVPTVNRQAFIEHSRSSWPIFRRAGALRMVECWGEDVPRGKQTDFYRATQAKEDETPIFSWILWPDRDSCDRAWASMEAQPEAAEMPPMPFDGSRMFWGGFRPVVEMGDSASGRYVQGFVLAVPGDRQQAYIDMARQATPMFQKFGATFQIECWGEDVPQGKQTDFYRAARAEPGEVAVFSWIEWPDRETCDAAARQMEAEMGSTPMPDMPFDGKRMFWGGFTPVVDERA
ncbi:MAG: DUF1428 domain-containing protein [Alphaproteobacteria bacterium]|nr:DUF1428 domain-containing protein [Alphaproteobacteria bacterium]